MQGTLTLPSLLLMDRHPNDNPVRRLFTDRKQPEHLKQAVEMIRDSDIPQESYKVATGFADRAEEALATLSRNPARSTLRDLLHYVLERRS